MTRPEPMAGAEPWAAALLRRGRRTGWLLAGSGLVLFILVGVGANVFVGKSERLRQSGGQASGVIVRFNELSATSDSAAVVDYTVDGRSYEEKVALGNHRPEFHVDQSVTVYYDTSDPATMTIDDINNEPTWTVLPMVIGFVAGVSLMIGGAVTLVSNHRKRRLLARQPWQEGARLLGVRDTGLYLSLPDGRLLRATRPAKAAAPDPGSRVRVVSPEKHILAVLGDQPTELLTARPARSQREEEGWRRLLGEAAS